MLVCSTTLLLYTWSRDSLHWVTPLPIGLPKIAPTTLPTNRLFMLIWLSEPPYTLFQSCWPAAEGCAFGFGSAHTLFSNSAFVEL